MFATHQEKTTDVRLVPPKFTPCIDHEIVNPSSIILRIVATNISQKDIHFNQHQETNSIDHFVTKVVDRSIPIKLFLLETISLLQWFPRRGTSRFPNHGSNELANIGIDSSLLLESRGEENDASFPTSLERIFVSLDDHTDVIPMFIERRLFEYRFVIIFDLHNAVIVI
jgi:hypothetical protein